MLEADKDKEVVMLEGTLVLLEVSEVALVAFVVLEMVPVALGARQERVTLAGSVSCTTDQR